MVYGGRKNCSNTTYMPRAISVRRKYLPALSREDSLPSSQRSFRGSRKPWGGGPAGVAARREVLVNVADGIVGRAARKAVRWMEFGRTRVSIVRERADAMVLSIGWRTMLRQSDSSKVNVNNVIEIACALIG